MVSLKQFDYQPGRFEDQGELCEHISPVLLFFSDIITSEGFSGRKPVLRQEALVRGLPPRRSLTDDACL